MKAFEDGNAFDIIGYENVCSCAAAFNFVSAPQLAHYRMLQLKIWSNLACTSLLWVCSGMPNLAMIIDWGGYIYRSLLKFKIWYFSSFSFGRGDCIHRST